MDLRRRLAAIVVADVAGYSRLTGQNEELTLATLKAYREIIDGLIARHEGRVFGSAGDSVLAEFASPVEAVRCATEIQLEIDTRNTNLPEPSRMRFRIGINLGDVVADGDNLLGDGVNVAARLEALAPAGGICVSEAIHAQVRDRVALDFVDLGEHKVKNIARPVRAYRVPLVSEERINSPFRGLDAFEFEHADLFFGRTHAICLCIDRLEQLAANGKSFLLIYGMSGSGKSSLLRAGLLPTITRPGAVAGIALWRRCLFRPSEGTDAIASLAAALLREDALPELAQETTVTDLTQYLRSAPERALGMIRAALAKATMPAHASAQARLVVALDQMEELFTTEVEPMSHTELVRALATFAGSGFVWVIGTIRSDFFHRCSEVPGFWTLKDGLSSYELLPPTGPEIAQIIREPARAAGLRFEEDADQGRLEDVLQEAAVADARSLPLLEFMLEALFQAGRERRLLTFAAYRAFGGLEGAIARRADEVVGSLPPDVQDALPAVLTALTTVRLDEEAITARPASLSQWSGRPAQIVLVNAMMAARLLASDENPAGDAVVRVTHEALLTRWPRARDIAYANRNFLETRARVQADARLWLFDNKNPDLLLPPGKRLAEGEELLSRRDEVEDEIVAYVEASLQMHQTRLAKERQVERMRIEAEETTKRERLESEAERRSLAAEAAIRLARRTRYAAIIAISLGVIAGAGAIAGFHGQHEARRQAMVAQVNADQARAAERKAIEARNQALRNQSLSLSLLSQQTAMTGDTEAAILLALEALPKDVAAPERPYVKEAEFALYQALFQHHQTMIFRHDAGVTYAAFNAGGDRIVTSSYDRTARIWNVANGTEMAVLRGHQGAVESTSFNPDGSRVVTASRDGTARIWDVAAGKQIFVLPQPGHVHTAMFSPAGTRVLTGSDQGALTIWDTKTGGRTEIAESFGTTSAAFSPDGLSVAAGNGHERSVRIWRIENRQLIRSLDNQFWPDEVVFSPDGSKILAASWGTITWTMASRLWDVPSGTLIASLLGHTSDIHGGTFSHDGRYIATVSLDGTARLWDGISGNMRRALGQETGGLKLSAFQAADGDQKMNCAFSPDDRLLATAAKENAVRIWDVESGTEFATIRGHRGPVTHLAFRPDGSGLLTASYDGTVRLWDIDGVLATTLRHQHRPAFAVFSPDGKRVMTGDTIARIWDVASSRETTRLETDGDAVEYGTFSPDGRVVATASSYGRITLWDAESGRATRRLAVNGTAVVHIQFSPRGDLLASASADGTAQLWNTSTGAKVAVLTASANLRKVLFSPDGKLVITALTDGTARLWRTDGTEVEILAGHQKRITAAVFSPDGGLAATSSLDGTARVWSTTDGSVVATLRGHGDGLTDIAFSQDGRSIVTASRDGTARIWNVPDGTERQILRGHDGALNYAAFSRNGSFVATASFEDHTVRLWDVDAGRQVMLLDNQRDATDTEPSSMRPAFSSDGTEIAVASAYRKVQIIRVFPTTGELIAFAHSIVLRDLTPCERKRFFLPVDGQRAVCRS